MSDTDIIVAAALAHAGRLDWEARNAFVIASGSAKGIAAFGAKKQAEADAIRAAAERITSCG